MLDYTAFAFGASAIYARPAALLLRVRNNETSAICRCSPTASNRAHAQGKRFYVVANIYPGAKIRPFIRDIAPVIALKPDALIMSDRA